MSARENRSKANQNPNQRLPTDPGAHCRYIEERTVNRAEVPLGLSADPSEVTALTDLADSCQDACITY
ncbi:hypothetical protein GCM10009548_74090 [Streptomyces malaysiensis subsp. malaysiensis]